MNLITSRSFPAMLIALAAIGSLYAPTVLAQSGSTRIINVGNSKCLTFSGSNAYIAACDGSYAQLWQRTATIYSGYQLRNVNSGRCIEATSGGGAVMAICDVNKRAQTWRRVFATVNSVFYQNANYNGCLDGSSGGTVKILACNQSSAYQAWR